MAYGDEQLKEMGLYERKQDIATRQSLMTPEELEEFNAGAKKSQTDANKVTVAAGAGSLAEINTDVAPAINTGADNVAATNAGVANSFAGDTAGMEKLIEQLAKQSEEAAKRAADAQKKWLKTAEDREAVRAGQKSTQDIYTEALAQYGYTPESLEQVKSWQGQLTTYNQQLADLEAQKNQALFNKEQQMQGYPGEILRGEQALIHKQYNLDISAKAAQAGVVAQQIQMERGLWSDARQTANQIVQLATYDQQQKLADLDWARDTYKDIYDMSSKEEQQAWDRAYTLAKDERDMAVRNAERVQDLNLSSKGQAGILPTDDYDTAVEKYNKWQASQPGEILSVAEAKSLGVPFGTTKEQAFGITPGGGAGLTGIPGQTLSFEELSPVAKMVVQGTYKLTDVTPTQKAEIAGELQAYGFTYVMASQDRQTVSLISNGMADVMSAWKSVPNKWKGLVQGWFGEKWGGKINSDVRQFEAARGIIGMQLTRLFEKGRISDEDRKFYMSLMPDLRTQNEETAQAGADELIRLLEEKMTSQLNELETGNINSTSQVEDYLEELGY